MQIRWAYLKRVLAGAIFGLYIANLLYFLNPQVDITPARLLVVTVVYGAICGLLFGSALWGLRALRVRLWGRPDEYRTHGFGFVVLAAFIASAIYWIHLEVFRIYLPIGAVRVLQKATNAITVTAFLLLLLWVLERNADRQRSRVVFITGVVLIALSSVVLYERRDSYRVEKQRVVVANIGTVAGQRPVLFVAIRNLPYDWIVTMNGEGSLPFFEQARSRAYFTRLEPFPTMDAKALWASIATGKLPFRHGVTGRFAYRTLLNRDPEDRFLIVPNGVGFKAWGLIPPVQRISTQLPSGDSLPIWTLFERIGLRGAVIDWPSSDAAGASIVVTDDFFDSANANRAREVSPRAFLPQAQRLLQQPAQGVMERFAAAGKARPRIAGALAADLSAVAIVRAVAPNRTFAFDAVALNGFEEAQRAIHIFANELPPSTNVKGEVARAYAEQIDRMLASLAHDFPDHLIVVVSPSGPVPPSISATPYEIVRDYVVADD
ncbi:MAG TPA: hypothetical protein VG323_16580, partial [Thermoanaerobaculia bacterium]|nr:hypothetical protein [Thermoanaerobaculia bacterium]